MQTKNWETTVLGCVTLVCKEETFEITEGKTIVTGVTRLPCRGLVLQCFVKMFFKKGRPDGPS